MKGIPCNLIPKRAKIIVHEGSIFGIPRIEENWLRTYSVKSNSITAGKKGDSHYRIFEKHKKKGYN